MPWTCHGGIFCSHDVPRRCHGAPLCTLRARQEDGGSGLSHRRGRFVYAPTCPPGHVASRKIPQNSRWGTSRDGPWRSHSPVPSLGHVIDGPPAVRLPCKDALPTARACHMTGRGGSRGPSFHRQGTSVTGRQRSRPPKPCCPVTGPRRIRPPKPLLPTTGACSHDPPPVVSVQT